MDCGNDRRRNARPPITASPAARLRHIAAELAALADALDERASPPPIAAPPDRWITTAVASSRANVSYATTYRWSRRYGIGEQTATGQWRYSESRLRALLSSDARRGENEENGEAARLPMLKRRAHVAGNDPARRPSASQRCARLANCSSLVAICMRCTRSLCALPGMAQGAPSTAPSSPRLGKGSGGAKADGCRGAAESGAERALRAGRTRRLSAASPPQPTPQPWHCGAAWAEEYGGAIMRQTSVHPATGLAARARPSSLASSRSPSFGKARSIAKGLTQALDELRNYARASGQAIAGKKARTATFMRASRKLRHLREAYRALERSAQCFANIESLCETPCAAPSARTRKVGTVFLNSIACDGRRAQDSRIFGAMKFALPLPGRARG